MGYGPWGHKESHITQRPTHTHIHRVWIRSEVPGLLSVFHVLYRMSFFSEVSVLKFSSTRDVEPLLILPSPTTHTCRYLLDLTLWINHGLIFQSSEGLKTSVTQRSLVCRGGPVIKCTKISDCGKVSRRALTDLSIYNISVGGEVESMVLVFLMCQHSKIAVGDDVVYWWWW